MYYRSLETSRKAKQRHDDAQKYAANVRLGRVREQVRAKKRAKKEAQA